MTAIDPKEFFSAEIERTERYLDSLKQALYSYLALSPGGEADESLSRKVDGATMMSSLFQHQNMDISLVSRNGNRPGRHKKTGKWATPPIALTTQVERIISNFEPGREFQISDIFSLLQDYGGEKSEAVTGRISTILGRLMAKPEKAVFERKERGIYIKKKNKNFPPGC